MSDQFLATPLPVDHAIIVVNDLAATSALLSGLGFVVSPLSRHSAKMGTWNFCVIFANLYLEFLAIEKETPLNIGWRHLLELGGGLRGLALKAEGIEQIRHGLDGQGIAHTQPLDFTRRGADSNEDLAFSVVRLRQVEPDDIQLLYCHHVTPHLLWRPGACAHANAVKAVHALGLQTLYPQSARQTLQKLASLGPLSANGLPVFARAENSFVSLSFLSLQHAQNFIAQACELGMGVRDVKDGVVLGAASLGLFGFHIKGDVLS